jgi:hypothetical protein
MHRETELLHGKHIFLGSVAEPEQLLHAPTQAEHRSVIRYGIFPQHLYVRAIMECQVLESTKCGNSQLFNLGVGV